MAAEIKSRAGGLHLWRNARLATMAEGAPGLGIAERGAVVARDGLITYAGPEADLPAALAQGADITNCEGRWVTPGLVDCHTHLVYAGNRANEFEMRLAGATYEEVAKAGGGIVSSVKSLRSASEDELVAQTLPRLDALIAEGVTTIEVKSGYGLDVDNEKKSLRAARRLGDKRSVTVRTTCLAAHALPPEAKGDKDAFID
ncbi:imidazolonepropionase, partial [Mesorhizobium sp. M4A.F.Ca.ET.022.05.2.1]